MNVAFIFAMMAGINAFVPVFITNEVTRSAFYGAAVIWGLVSIIIAIEASAKQIAQAISIYRSS